MKKILLTLLIALVALSAAFAETDWYLGASFASEPKAKSTDLGVGFYCSTTSRPITHGSLIYYTTEGLSMPLIGLEDSFEIRGAAAVIAGLENDYNSPLYVRGGLGLSTTVRVVFSENDPVYVQDLRVCLDLEAHQVLSESFFIVAGINAGIPLIQVASYAESEEADVTFVDTLNGRIDCRLGLGIKF